MKRLSLIAAAYKLVWVRVSCYFMIPYVATFLTLTEMFSGDGWDELHWFLKLRIHLACFIAGVTPLIAFIDQSLGRAKGELAERKATDQADRIIDAALPPQP